MQELMTFFGEFIVVTAVAGMLYTLAPEGAQKKYMQFAISLCVLTALIGPMLSVVSSLPEILEDAELSFEDERLDVENDLQYAVIEQSRSNIEESVVLLLSERFDIESEEIRVTVELDSSDMENIKILSVTVSVPGSSAVERTQMKQYLSEEFRETAEIKITNLE